MTRWLMRPGPAITPLEALARIADAPVIAMLHGHQGTSLAWYDVPPQSAADIDHTAVLREWASGAERLVQRHLHGLPPADPRSGLTWCDVPPESCFVQCDYEFPESQPRLVFAPQVVRWDGAESCVLLGPDAGVLETMGERLSGPARTIAPPTVSAPFTPEWDAEGHRERVQRIRDYIAAGDCYQVNLAVPFHGRLVSAPHRDLAAFIALMEQSPGPFSAFFRTPDRPSVVSHSPECLVSLRSDLLTSVPIKGTRRRVAGQEDALWNELRTASKDDAELAMIVDLVRNDLGRVAVTGSVHVSDPALRIDLPYVIHRAARIDARLRPGLTAYDILRATFPAGSITGAPKRRVMEIIQELEGTPRGAYCGAFGWIGPGGADLAVAIRTAEIDGDRVAFRAGGGVVWDSDPAAEWDEVRAKASGMATALGGMV